MKQILSILCAAVVLCGCATTTGNSSFNVQQAAALVQVAAMDGTVATLAANPQYRPGFVAATNLLSTVSVTNAMDIISLVKNLQVGGKSATYVQLGVANALTLLNAAGVNVGALPLTNQLAAVSVLQQAVNSGISQGLQMSQ